MQSARQIDWISSKKAQPAGCFARALAMVLIGTSSLNSQAAEAAQPGVDHGIPEENQVEAFKRFVAAPPIDTIIFRKKLLADVREGNSDIGIAHSKQYLFYRASWGMKHLTIKTGPALFDLDSPKVSSMTIHRKGRDHWLFLPGMHAFYWYNNLDTGAKRAEAETNNNQVFSMTQFMERDLVRVMNMGVYNLGIATIRWEGNNFKGRFAEQKQDIFGKLNVGQDGAPKSMDVEYNSPGHRLTYRIDYQCSINAPAWPLPELIRVVQIKGTNQIERDEFQILKVSQSGAEDPESAITTAIKANALKTAVLTNGNFYFREEAGDLKRISKAALHIAPRPAPSPKRSYAAFATVSLVFLILAVGISFVKQNNPTSKVL